MCTGWRRDWDGIKGVLNVTVIEISIERAIERLKFIKKYELQPADKLSFAAISMAISALEKQLPKTAEYKIHDKWFGMGKRDWCPVCDYMFETIEDILYLSLIHI